MEAPWARGFGFPWRAGRLAWQLNTRFKEVSFSKLLWGTRSFMGGVRH